MNFFDEKKTFLQDQVGADKANWPELLKLSKKQRKNVMKNMIHTKGGNTHTSVEKQLLDTYDQELADLERRRVNMEASLKSTRTRLRDLLTKRKRLVKVLGLESKPSQV